LRSAHPDDRSELKASIRESAQEMTPWNHEFRFLVDGKTRWIAGNAAPERESDGSVLWHGFVSDVTERVEAETARLSLESQLRESQKMEAIGTLAGGIAHDFNNALAAILANVELAQNTAAGNDLLKYFLGEIQRAGFRSRELVKQILSFCRRQPTSLRQISLGKIAQESVSMLRATLQARVTLNLTIEDDLPSVLADDTQIEQVIVNLVSNAMQAITNLSGAVEVRLDSVRADAAELAMAPSLNELSCVSSGRLVRLSVSDNGPGMVPSIRERIFEPFFTTKPQGEGTGLGLAVVHGIVKSHGGVIDVDSKPGKGTTFRIFLPAMLNSSDAPQSFKEQMLKEPSTDSLNRPAKFANAKRGQILLIEDDEAVLHSIQFLLNALGYSVSAFSDPHAGLEAFRKDPVSFQMVVTDQNMPTISGLAVVGTVRAIDPNLPVVLMSGFVDNELQTVAVKAGVSVLIAKPFTALELDEKLRPLLS
jgi:two-component system cell cycle sensor histidine kinase/response regulator CckA